MRAFLIGLALLAAPPALAGEALTPQSHVLEPARVDPADATLDRMVDTGGDQVLAAHVIARPHSSNAFLMRDANGFFVPWDGDPDHLADTGARPEGGRMVFKVLRGPLGGTLLPVTIILAYRTPAGLKFGQFELEARP